MDIYKEIKTLPVKDMLKNRDLSSSTFFSLKVVFKRHLKSSFFILAPIFLIVLSYIRKRCLYSLLSYVHFFFKSVGLCSFPSDLLPPLHIFVLSLLCKAF